MSKNLQKPRHCEEIHGSDANRGWDDGAISYFRLAAKVGLIFYNPLVHWKLGEEYGINRNLQNKQALLGDTAPEYSVLKMLAANEFK